MPKKISVKGPIVTNDIAWVYHYFGWDACSPNDIADGLKEANGDDVILEINSNGGVCTQGFEMYKIIKEYEGNVEAHVINAASAASFLVCAADKALASDGAILMIHNAQCSASGDYRDMQMEADALREFNKSVINIYVRKTGKSREELQTMMDNDTYMSPEKAIANGFIDGYLFGDPNESGEESNVTKNLSGLQVMNAATPVLSEEKAKEIMALLKAKNESPSSGEKNPKGKQSFKTIKVAGVKVQNNSAANSADSDIEQVVNKSEKGAEKNMTLEEMFNEHPELKNEVDGMVENAKKDGAAAERSRLEALDAIQAGVPSDTLKKAKYGDEKERMDARELAYQAMLSDGAEAKNYFKNAVTDSEESGIEDVGTGTSDEEETDESDSMAGYVNARKRGGKRA